MPLLCTNSVRGFPLPSEGSPTPGCTCRWVAELASACLFSLSAPSSPGLPGCSWSTHSSTLFPQPQMSLLLGLVGLVYICCTFKCQYKQPLLKDTFLRSLGELLPSCAPAVPSSSPVIANLLCPTLPAEGAERHNSFPI